MNDAIPEFDYTEIVRSRDSQNVEPVANSPQLSEASKITKKRKRDPQLVHLLKKVSFQSTLLCVVLPLFSLFKLILSKPEWNGKLLKCLAVYMFISQVSLVAGYHRFFTHAAFQCDLMVQSIFAILGGSCGLGSILDFSSQHLAHHHYVDTERDPHACVVHGWLFAQWGHKLFHGNRKSARAVQECRNTLESTAKASTSKVETNYISSPSYALLRWQDENYAEILVLTIILIPCILAKFCKVPFFSGVFYLGLVRMSIIQQQWLLIGSLCHTKRFPLASQPFDDSRSAVDLPFGTIMDLLTFGESNHNFHHEFPGDYRNGPGKYQWDPAKFAILVLYYLGLVGKLHSAGQDQIEKCLVQQQQKLLDDERSKLQWGIPLDKLPIMPAEVFVRMAKQEFQEHRRALVAIEGVVHDVTPFIHDHPGGVALVETSIGKDATQAFNGAVYLHSQAARNLLATMRIAVIGSGHMGIESTVWEKHILESSNWKNDTKGREIVRNKQQVTFTNKNHYAAGAA
ncbi:KLTH0G06358p [Lachancea thermotolerans CBS 6340]|uniref:Acyl-CoA desaturase n=1 Tax=Lachancea thermotolerans (strain ATCC 56472 / CBS 6340 / NRRL Y-8284) TaxID=559295 RepID=C5DM66_LACTC|nr:KLTH0G06358p [Lachancea thermotolerans CBS 6340]CAR24877.1 KLTH0G06358p [Lachancea thermotolerans CBS 6340]